MQRSDFGEEFVWGVASAAFQIEGAWDADGKAPSVWDEAGRRGRIRGGRVGDVAIDAYHRFAEDLGLIASLGVRANRFSISWPRVLGEGRGPWNAKGGDYYDRVIDGCLARGIEPWVTVHHWDMPLALGREGGWARRGIVEDFAAYAEAVARRYGDRVKHWMVFNEPLSVVGHVFIGVHGRWGPHPFAALASAHHMNLASAEAGRRMRAVLPKDAVIGSANVFTIPSPYRTDDRRMRRAAAAYEALTVRLFVDPPAGLGYPFGATPLLRPLRRYIQEGDLERVRFDYDFQGLQYYGPLPLRRAPVPGLGAVPTRRAAEAEAMLASAVGVPVEPGGLLEILRRYRNHPGCRRMILTENGFGGWDRLEGGRVRDELRIGYVKRHLEMVLAARREGIPIDGYFYWSYADNIEWLFGRDARFGLVHVDYENGCTRTLKDSALWLRDFLAGKEL